MRVQFRRKVTLGKTIMVFHRGTTCLWTGPQGIALFVTIHDTSVRASRGFTTVKINCSIDLGIRGAFKEFKTLHHISQRRRIRVQIDSRNKTRALALQCVAYSIDVINSLRSPGASQFAHGILHLL